MPERGAGARLSPPPPSRRKNNPPLQCQGDFGKMPSYPEPRSDEVQRRNSAPKGKDVYADSELFLKSAKRQEAIDEWKELYLP